MADINDWSTTAGSNNAAAPNGWPEGMNYSDVNDTGRENMAVVARFFKDINGSLTTTGAANAYAVTLNSGYTSYFDGMMFAASISADNTGASTVNVNGIGIKSIVASDGSALKGGELQSGQIYTFRYDGTDFHFDGASGPLSITTMVASGNAEFSSNVEIGGQIYIGDNKAIFIKNSELADYPVIQRFGDDVYIDSYGTSTGSGDILLRPRSSSGVVTTALTLAAGGNATFNGQIAVATTGNFAVFNNGSNIGRFTHSGTQFLIDGMDSGGSIGFRTNGATTALTLDSSQHATFSGNLKVNGAFSSNASAGQASIFGDSTWGGVFAGNGSSSDLAFQNKNGEVVSYTPTGTKEMYITGGVLGIGFTAGTAATSTATTSLEFQGASSEIAFSGASLFYGTDGGGLGSADDLEFRGFNEIFMNLPTSAGTAGSLWNDGGTVKVA